MTRKEPENWLSANELLDQGKHREALELYKQMAERDVPGACAEVAIQYELGIEGEPPDIEKAVSWFDEGVRRDETESMIGLGRLILARKTILREHEYALELYARRWNAWRILGRYSVSDASTMMDSASSETRRSRFPTTPERIESGIFWLGCEWPAFTGRTAIGCAFSV